MRLCSSSHSGFHFFYILLAGVYMLFDVTFYTDFPQCLHPVCSFIQVEPAFVECTYLSIRGLFPITGAMVYAADDEAEGLGLAIPESALPMLSYLRTDGFHFFHVDRVTYCETPREGQIQSGWETTMDALRAMVISEAADREEYYDSIPCADYYLQ